MIKIVSDIFLDKAYALSVVFFLSFFFFFKNRSWLSLLESCAFPFYYYLFIISRLCPDQNYWCRSSLTTLLVSTGSVDFCGISDLYTVLHGNLPVTSQDHFGEHQYWVLVIANIGWHSDSHLNCVFMAARMVVDGSMASKPPWSRFRHAHGKWAWLQERKGTAHNLSWYCTYHATSPVRIYGLWLTNLFNVH